MPACAPISGCGYFCLSLIDRRVLALSAEPGALRLLLLWDLDLGGEALAAAEEMGMVKLANDALALKVQVQGILTRHKRTSGSCPGHSVGRDTERD